MPLGFTGAPASISAWIISTVTGVGPEAERIRATSPSRKDWGFKPESVGIFGIIVRHVCFYSGKPTITQPLQTIWINSAGIPLDVSSKTWLMCGCVIETIFSIPFFRRTAMKKNEVQIGGVYTAKITNKLVQVRIDAASRYGGWDATNLATNKKVRIKSPAKLREAVGGDTAKPKAKKAKATKDAKVEKDRDTAQTVATQGQGEAAAVVCPNCGGTEVDDEGDCKKCHEPDIAKQATAEKPAKKSRAKKEKAEKPKRVSALDAAAMVLADTGQPMNAKEIVEAALAKKPLEIAGRQDAARHSVQRHAQGDHRQGRRGPLPQDRTREVRSRLIPREIFPSLPRLFDRGFLRFLAFFGRFLHFFAGEWLVAKSL